MLNYAKEICDALELCAYEMDGAISGENAQDAGYLSGCILVQLGRIRECIAALSSNKNGKIITDIRLFAIGDQWGAEVEYPDGTQSLFGLLMATKAPRIGRMMKRDTKSS